MSEQAPQFIESEPEQPVFQDESQLFDIADDDFVPGMRPFYTFESTDPELAGIDLQDSDWKMTGVHNVMLEDGSVQLGVQLDNPYTGGHRSSVLLNTFDNWAPSGELDHAENSDHKAAQLGALASLDVKMEPISPIRYAHVEQDPIAIQVSDALVPAEPGQPQEPGGEMTVEYDAWDGRAWDAVSENPLDYIDAKTGEDADIEPTEQPPIAA